jgi:HSP20 family protein
MAHRPQGSETDLHRLRERMDDPLERLFEFVASPRYCLHATWRPSIDLFRTADGIAVVAELPGVDDADLRVTVEDGRLRIAGIRRPPQELEQAEALQLEIDYGPFERQIVLPAGSDSDHITARFRYGLLTVHVPLRTPARITVPVTVPAGPAALEGSEPIE